MEIPQEVLDRVMNMLRSREWGDSDFEDAVDELMPLAQLPIAPATPEERMRAWNILRKSQKLSKDLLDCALEDFVRRRNSPQVDPR
jgi:hypothetical protein